MSINILLVINAILFFFGCFIWSSTNWPNILTKTLLFIAALVNLIVVFGVKF